jgi:large repetitive protein
LPNGNRASSGITTVTATDAESDAITFSQISGTLPTGITFNSDGTFSGTADAEASDTTYTFTIRATAGGKTTDRQYTITVNAPATQLITKE